MKKIIISLLIACSTTSCQRVKNEELQPAGKEIMYFKVEAIYKTTGDSLQITPTIHN